MKTRSRTRRLFLALLWMGAGVAAVVYADGPIRLSHDLPGETKPIAIGADEVATWTEGNSTVFLLKGHVRIEQGAVWARFQNGVAFVDRKGPAEAPTWDVAIYGEGDAAVQNGAEVQSGTTAVLDLHTGGHVGLNADKGKVIQQARTDDPVYRRGLAQFGRAPPPIPETPDAIQRTGFAAPADAAGSVTPAAPTQGPLPPPAPPPGTLPPPPPPGTLPPPPPVMPAVTRQFSMVPRNLTFGLKTLGIRQLPGQPPERIGVATGGFILTIRSTDPKTNAVTILDIEADRGVFWSPVDQGDKSPAVDGLTGREAEFYLAGSVEIREHSGRDERTMRADEVYYDVSRNVALALSADVEWVQPGVPDKIHFQGDEIQVLSQTQFKGLRGNFSSSKLPSDPGLKIQFAEATLEEKKQIRRNLFGREVVDIRTDQPVIEVQKLIRADDVILRIEDVPVFWLPFVQTDANDPLGPVRDISIGYNRIYGFQASVTLDVYDLIGISKLPNTNWKMDTDYYSNRGPALGTQYDFTGKDPFGIPGVYVGEFKSWSIYDTGTDDLGGGRPDGEPHPTWRTWDLFQVNVRELPLGFSVQAVADYLSDKNFYEQYFKNQFDTEPNKETFLYVKQQQDNWAWTGLVEPRIRDWVNETEALPRFDGYLIGQSLFDTLTYSAHASAGYFQLMPTDLPPPPADLTTRRVNTARFDFMQQVGLPFYAGPVKVVPYGVLDLTAYTEDLNGNSIGRVYGGAGVQASIPFTRLYPDVHSLLWNLDGINHKIVVSGNYYYAGSDVPFTRLPQLDRLNDDVNDFSYNDMKPLQPTFNPANGLALATSPVYDTQLYALRNLVLNKIDTLGTEEELQLDLRQRWQTKRGFPGEEHIIDWMTLDLSATVFPAANRDNFGSAVGFLQYDWSWNIGDRTALTSTGWVDPETNGPRFFSVGAYLNRTDRTNLFLGYRQIDPLESKAVTAAFTYVFSPKYAMTASSTYDFGTSEALSNSLVLTRMGSDLQFSLGITYNALTNNVGVVVELVPNLIGNRRVPGLGSGMIQH